MGVNYSLLPESSVIAKSDGFMKRRRPFTCLELHRSNGAFPTEGAVRFGSQKCSTVHVSTAKSGGDPD